MTIEEFKCLIQETVTDTLEILLSDRDEDEQLKPEVVQELIESLQRTQGGDPNIPASEVAKKLGLKW